MDRGIWALWYDIEPDAEREYLDWFHGVHIPEKLSRPGYVWAAHYRLHAEPRLEQAAAQLAHADLPARGRGYLAMFGGSTVRAFLDPSPAQLKERQDDLTRRMIGLRRSPGAAVLAEETRIDGPAAATRAPGVTPGPVIVMESFVAADPKAEDDIAAWHVQELFPFMQALPGSIGARRLLATLGWGRYALLLEFDSLASLREGYVPRAASMPDAGTRAGRAVRACVHAPCSPLAATRIWPPAAA